MGAAACLPAGAPRSCPTGLFNLAVHHLAIGVHRTGRALAVDTLRKARHASKNSFAPKGQPGREGTPAKHKRAVETTIGPVTAENPRPARCRVAQRSAPMQACFAARRTNMHSCSTFYCTLPSSPNCCLISGVNCQLLAQALLPLRCRAAHLAWLHGSLQRGCSQGSSWPLAAGLTCGYSSRAHIQDSTNTAMRGRRGRRRQGRWARRCARAGIPATPQSLLLMRCRPSLTSPRGGPRMTPHKRPACTAEAPSDRTTAARPRQLQGGGQKGGGGPGARQRARLPAGERGQGRRGCGDGCAPALHRRLHDLARTLCDRIRACRPASKCSGQRPRRSRAPTPPCPCHAPNPLVRTLLCSLAAARLRRLAAAGAHLHDRLLGFQHHGGGRTGPGSGASCHR